MASPIVSVVSPGLPPPPGGLQRLALDVHEGLRARTTSRAIGISAARSDDASVEVVPTGRGAGLRLAGASIQHVRRWKPDVIQAMTWKVAAPVVGPTSRSSLLAVYAHGAELVRPGPALGRLRDFVLDRCDVVVANSAYTASVVGEMTTTTVRVVCPGVRLPHAPSARARHEDTLHVASVGALVARKGHDRLIRAVHDARRGGAALRLTIVGDGPERSALEALIASLGAADFVRLAGRLSDDEVDAVYREADAFALLGHAVGDEFEGFGIVLLEAAAYGLPIVTTATGGTVDAVRAGVNALIVDDVAEATKALVTLCDDKSTADRLAREGLAFAAVSTVDAKAAELLAVYDELG